MRSPFQRGRLRQGGLLFAGAIALAVVGMMSLLPPEAKFALHTQGVLHPWLHLGSFMLVAFLLAGGTPSPKARTVIFVAVILFGLGTEILEHLINATPLEASDVFADTVGASLGLLGALFLSEH